MPTVKCGKCGSKVSDQYSYCTVCQAPLSREQHYADTSVSTSKFKTSSIYWVALFISGVVAFSGLHFIGGAFYDVVSWLVFFSSYFIILAGYTFFTGKPVHIGETQISSWRTARFSILGIVFVVGGYLLGGETGLFIGILVAGGLSVAIQLWLDHIHGKAHRPKSKVKLVSLLIIVVVGLLLILSILLIQSPWGQHATTH